RSMGTMVFLRATIVPHSSVGTPWVTLCVTDLRRATDQERTRSVQNGIPTRSMGMMVFLRATIVPHAPA
ncbi:hypothetical protein, partial [Pseudomonas syringae]